MKIQAYGSIKLCHNGHNKHKLVLLFTQQVSLLPGVAICPFYKIIRHIGIFSKTILATKNILSSFERAFKRSNKAFWRFFIPSSIVEIFRLKHTICPPFGIFKDMHVRHECDEATFNY